MTSLAHPIFHATPDTTIGTLGSDAKPNPSHALPLYFQTLSDDLGAMRWWPARSPFEVIVGAILTQNTAWSNVEPAIANLRRARLLTARAIRRVRTARLARLIRPSGYFRQKARKLKAFVRLLRREYGGSLKRMFRTPTAALREQLLAVHGIGPETADAILLYAGGHATFVVDAYTLRILARHGLTPAGSANGKRGYESVRAMFENSLPRQAALYNEFHALIVHVGKQWCRARVPRCGECPLRNFLPANSPLRLSEPARAFHPPVAQP
jgi:endonuclease III related protein